MSRPCATFANPAPLLSSPTPTIAAVEVWLLEPLVGEEGEDGVVGTTGGRGSGGAGNVHASSVLTTHGSDRQFMKLAGVSVDSSAGYRSGAHRAEPPIEEDV